MNGCPPTELPERPGRPSAGLLGPILALACLVGAGCATPLPSDTAVASAGVASASAPDVATERPSSGASEDRPGDVDGLVVLTGGAIEIGSPRGAFVDLGGPPGRITGLAAARGRLIAALAEPAFVIADVDRSGSASIVWRGAGIPVAKLPERLSQPALSPRGGLVAFVDPTPGVDGSLEIVVVDLEVGELRLTSIAREANGPPVWISESSLLVEVLPIPGGTRFLRLDVATGRVDPVSADGYGPAISGDGSVLAVTASDGSVLAVPAAGWLNGGPPDEGAIVDASGSPFALAVDASGARIAIGFADAAGDPASITIFVREGAAWRRSGATVKVVPGTVTMLGWLS